jgi:thiol:disulfide interchange protein
MPRFALISLLLWTSLGAAWAQKKDPVQWELTSSVTSIAPGATVPLKFQATIQKGWHIYSLTSEEGPGKPLRTKVAAVANPAVEDASIYQPTPLRKVDPTIGLDTEMFEDGVALWVPVRIKADAKGEIEVAAEARYQACDDRECLRPVTKIGTVRLQVDTTVVAASPWTVPAGYANIADPRAVALQSARAKAGPTNEGSSDEGWIAFALTAFGFGLASIVTPCVFPMIPITVSFFLTQRGGILQAFVFAGGIVGLFCGLALALTAILGPFGVNQMSSNPWVNGFVALLFTAFAMSLLGAFEIALPSSVLTKMDQASRRGGYLGSLLMGLTFSLTSFACVGPFVGSLLASSVQSASLTRPVVGMASFAVGLASPFFFLAAFPSYLQKLPRSGGWLMRVKVVMGFVLLAVMLKYLSNVDQVLQTGWLTRERFLAAWVVLFALPGLYLLGFLRMEGVEPGESMGVGRLLSGAGFLTFAISLLPGMFGTPLGELDAYVPIAIHRGIGTSGANEASGPSWMKDQYREALAQARAENKVVLVTFTGYTCTNCHLMKATLFTRPEVSSELEKFVRVELYTDGLEAVAAENQTLQDRFNTTSQPFYVLMQGDETVLATFSGFTRDSKAFLDFLAKATMASGAKL